MLKATFLHYAAAHESAPAASARLRGAIVHATGKPVNLQKVADLVVICWNLSHFEAAQRWHAGSPVSWWEISFAEAVEAVFARHDPVNWAGSAAAGVAFCLEELAHAGFADVTVDASGPAWTLSARNIELASVAVAHYETVGVGAEARVARTLEGLRAYGDNARLAERLRELPGLGEVREVRSSDRDRTPEGPPIASSPRGLAKGLRLNVHDRLDIELSQGQAQECVAALFGFSSWNEMVALEARSVGWHPPVSVYESTPTGLSVWRKHFRSTEAAICGLVEAVRNDSRRLTVEVYGSSGIGGLSLMAVEGTRTSILEFDDPVLSCSESPIVAASEETSLAAADEAMAKARADGSAIVGSRD